MTMYVTNCCNGDGFGSQYQLMISVLLICYVNNYTFVYSPITKIEHNYDNQDDFIEKIESLMNLRSFFISRNDKSLEGQYITVCDATAKYVIDGNIDFYAREEYIEKIRAMFWQNKDRSNVWTNGKTNVAVHIRRPNPHDNRLEGADTPDHYYVELIERIRREHSDKDLLFHIYSQGSMDLFETYRSSDVVFHIDEDICESFIAMVAADMLVISASSLSYIAAFLSEGIIYYMPFWHPQRSHWIKTC